MSRTIWKYGIEVTDRFALEIPGNFKVLCVKNQNRNGSFVDGRPCMWIDVDPAIQSASHNFFVVGTGGPIPDGARHYIGTWLDGPFVWHLFME